MLRDWFKKMQNEGKFPDKDPQTRLYPSQPAPDP